MSRFPHNLYSPRFRPTLCYPPAQMAFQPMPLSRRLLPFDHPEWIFELKYDGFRSLAVLQNGRTQLNLPQRESLQFFRRPLQGTDLAAWWENCARWRDCLSG